MKYITETIFHYVLRLYILMSTACCMAAILVKNKTASKQRSSFFSGRGVPQTVNKTLGVFNGRSCICTKYISRFCVGDPTVISMRVSGVLEFLSIHKTKVYL